MSVWRNIVDVVTRGIASERTYRREHPAETAQMFRRRESYWRGCGRLGLARIASRRAARWEARAAEEEKGR